MKEDNGASSATTGLPMNGAEQVVSAVPVGIPSALDFAIKLAVDSHAGQVDKAGAPYILHPLRVMLASKGDDAQIAAVLHDTAEDCGLPLSLIGSLFGETVADAVDALTRRDGETYEAFIERCAVNPIARKVKLADLADNMNLDRLGREPTLEDARRCWKYGQAQNVLRCANRDSDQSPEGIETSGSTEGASAGSQTIAQQVSA